MIFLNKCFNCSCKSDIEKEQDAAKAFWRKYRIRYLFPCGACYYPESASAEVYPYRPCSKK